MRERAHPPLLIARVISGRNWQREGGAGGRAESLILADASPPDNWSICARDVLALNSFTRGEGRHFVCVFKSAATWKLHHNYNYAQ